MDTLTVDDIEVYDKLHTYRYIKRNWFQKWIGGFIENTTATFQIIDKTERDGNEALVAISLDGISPSEHIFTTPSELRQIVDDVDSAEIERAVFTSGGELTYKTFRVENND